MNTTKINIINDTSKSESIFEDLELFDFFSINKDDGCVFMKTSDSKYNLNCIRFTYRVGDKPKFDEMESNVIIHPIKSLNIVITEYK